MGDNIVSGQYRFTSASCTESNYTLFMGCSDDIKVAEPSPHSQSIGVIKQFESEISCDLVVSGAIPPEAPSVETNKYYKFNVLERMDWFSFDTCINTNFHIHRLIVYMFDGRMRLIQSEGHYTKCLTVNATNIEKGTYYISVVSQNEGQYTLNMQCSNNDKVALAHHYIEYLYHQRSVDNMNYIQMIAIMIIAVTVPMIGSYIFYKLWNKKLKQVAKDIIFTAEIQRIDVNEIEDQVTRKDVVVPTQQECKDHIELTKNDQMEQQIR